MVDYSKWKNIEISDDEDETHPNIDTPSLYRWRHQARIERMEEHKKAVDDHNKKKAEHAEKLSDVKTKLADAENTGTSSVADLKKALEELEKEDESIKNQGDELKKKEKKTPWNVDTISKDGFVKTVINKKPARPKDEDLTDEERETRMRKFVKTYEKELKHYGMLSRFDDSKDYLKSHGHLVCDDTANYLVLWCINLEMEGKHDLMSHVAHQTICMQYTLELAKQLDCDPRACVDAFFSRIQLAEHEYRATFNEELANFKERIRKRSAEKLEEAMKEVEEEERQKRLGPGGLDPVEVFESLPDDLKKCFESQDIALLQETVATMDEAQAKYHIKRCIDSGLWVPDSKSNAGDAGTSGSSDSTTERQEPDES